MYYTRNVIRFLVLVLISTLLIFTTSCSKSTESSKKPVELTFWGPFGGGDGENMKQLVNEFNKVHKDVQVKFLILPWGDYYTKLRISIVAASAPDLAICHASKIAQMAATGNLENLTPLAQEAGLKWNSFSKNPLEAGQYEKVQYGVPIDTHAMVLYYNVDILRKSGILGPNESKLTFPNGAKSFIDYLEIIKKKNPGVFPFGSESKGAIPQFWIWYCFYSQFKDAPPYISATKAEFDNKYGLKALELMKELVDKKLWPYGIANSLDLFKSGKSAMIIEGVWGMSQIEDKKDLNFRIEPLPKLFDRQACWGDSHTIIIPKQKSNERMLASMKFVDWLTKNSALWAKAGHIPARKSVLKTPEFKKLKYRSDYAGAANITLRMPDNEYLTNVNDEIAREIGEMLNNNSSAEKTLKTMTKNVNAVLQF